MADVIGGGSTVTATHTPTSTNTSTATGTATVTASPSTTATSTSTSTSTATPAGMCGEAWRLQNTGDGTVAGGVQRGVDAISPYDAWSVGSVGSGITAPSYARHWNGVNWTVVPVPTPQGASGTYLYGVDAVSSSDVWAVGSYAAQGIKAFIVHWNGSSWNVKPVQHNTSTTSLYGVVAISSNNAWAVGSSYPMPLIVHWDGNAWNTIYNVPTPDQNGHSSLNGIDARSASDVWAVGQYLDSASNQYKTLTMHYDGTSWSIKPSPNQGAYHNQLQAVSIDASGNVWAVGFYNTSSTYDPSSAQALVMRWDGSNWIIQNGATIGLNSSSSDLHAVEAVGPNDVWAAGEYRSVSGGMPKAFVSHYDGNGWSIAALPDMSYADSRLYDLAQVPGSPSDLWAVGSAGGYSLALRHNDPCAVATPTSTQTSTQTPTASATNSATATPTITPTSTNTPTSTVTGTPTSTPTSTPTGVPSSTRTAVPPATACPIQFVDVPASGSGSTFHSFIKCLACRAIVSGYPCGGPGEPCPGAYFRPGVNVTRGQISKMVALAADLSGPTGGQLFEDVPTNSTFYDPIQQLASRGYIGGYPCGTTPAELCQEGNRPYFRPGLNTTRGQLSKIVSETARFDEASGSKKFADVPTDSPFFVWINRLANRGVISGYGCGGAGEPCDAGNLPYFRPGENVTRGQTAKIVANTFFPNCQTPSRQ
ncbi:MAG: S-layer homology domain-containing protein [Chloroflexota bacterium]|nr:S-layer homology domain-containing protein [Chloroflexota bacterium]MDQ5864263.1 S-layer homology domain-containing protein [Chloroflexota bacterium]